MENIIKSLREAYPQYANSMPTSEENAEIIKRIKNGDEKAKTELVCRNAMLAAKMTNKFYKGSSKGDAFISALEGMLIAAMRYDESIGAFSTYATVWMRQVIQRENYAKDALIRLPEHCRLPYIKYKQMISKPEKKELSDEYLAENLGISMDTLTIFKEYYSKSILSIDEPIFNGKGDNDTVFGDYIPDISQNVEDDIVDHEHFREVHKIMEQSLNEREYKILTMRYGLLDGRTYTLQEVADSFTPSITRERVRQIENGAMWRVRKNPDILRIMKEHYPKMYNVTKEHGAPPNALNKKSYRMLAKA